MMSENVLVPHRDFVEFTERPAEVLATHRLHVPLATAEDCLFMEDNVIYRMLPGEVWSLDVSRMHSAAVLCDTRRAPEIHAPADVEGQVHAPGVAEHGRAEIGRAHA